MVIPLMADEPCAHQTKINIHQLHHPKLITTTGLFSIHVWLTVCAHRERCITRIAQHART
jgi:hypothetical protein